MTVSKEITRLEHSALKLTVTLGKDEVRSTYDGLLSEYTKTIQIPGFRKGKVPKDVLVRKFGDAFKSEALGRIIEKSLGEVFEDEAFPRENRPLPYSTPELQGEPKLDLEADLIYSVVYDVLPVLTVGKWQGLDIEVPDVQIEDEDLGRELEAVRERNAIVLDRDEGIPAAQGDVVTVNYAELSGTGEVIAGSEREDFVFTLGSGYNYFEIDDEMLGMKKGETRTLEKTYPADHKNEDLAGKSKKIRVNLTALKEKKLPDLDDDLAQDVDEKFTTLEDLKNNIRDRLAKDLERRLRGIKVSAILEKIMESTPVDIPESMIRLELESRWRNLARRFNTDAAGLRNIMEKADDGSDKITEGWRADSVKALHSRLIVETLIQDLKFEAPDEEMEKEFEVMAEEAGTTLEEVKKYYTQDNMKEYLQEDIKERKLFDRLLSENNIKPGKKEKYLDLTVNNG